eukprot:TRINITY_DN2752_c0_g1_i1.p1 TRINITY_DN2752_c0_g1~~TRINITY_DN2752_c0_g1_i1.p1  ORF type:complete len:146 (-),score=20.20 TRINITY_DN2752_c0_g1_i1:452-889(-)
MYCNVNPTKLASEIRKIFRELASEQTGENAMMEVDPPPKISQIPPSVSKVSHQSHAKGINSPNGVVNFYWDPDACAQNINLSENNMFCFLMETGFCFRSVVGNIGFVGGIAYWEIHGDNRTENELKIGIVAKKNFNLNTVLSIRQ